MDESMNGVLSLQIDPKACNPRSMNKVSTYSSIPSYIYPHIQASTRHSSIHPFLHTFIHTFMHSIVIHLFTNSFNHPSREARV